MDSIPIIILNWNNSKDTIRCLRSLYLIDYDNYHVILIDNGSKDDSVEKITEWALERRIKIFVFKDLEITNENNILDKYINEYLYFKSNERMIFILSGKNRGYAGGMNLGLMFVLKYLRKVSDVKYVLLLNNDTLLSRNFLKELVDVAERYDRIGVVGPCVHHYYTKKFIPIEQYIIPIPLASLYGGIFNNLFIRENIVKHSYGASVVNRLDGSCMLIKLGILDHTGLFDENFFSYWEDTDLLTRVKKCKYLVVYVPSSIIRHKIGAGYINLRKINTLAAYLMVRNGVYFIKKHFKNFKKFILLSYFTLFVIYYSFSLLGYFMNINATKMAFLGLIRAFLGEVGEPKKGF